MASHSPLVEKFLIKYQISNPEYLSMISYMLSMKKKIIPDREFIDIMRSDYDVDIEIKDYMNIALFLSQYFNFDTYLSIGGIRKPKGLKADIIKILESKEEKYSRRNVRTSYLEFLVDVFLTRIGLNTKKRLAMLRSFIFLYSKNTNLNFSDIVEYSHQHYSCSLKYNSFKSFIGKVFDASSLSIDSIKQKGFRIIFTIHSFDDMLLILRKYPIVEKKSTDDETFIQNFMQDMLNSLSEEVLNDQLHNEKEIYLTRLPPLNDINQYLNIPYDDIKFEDKKFVDLIFYLAEFNKTEEFIVPIICNLTRLLCQNDLLNDKLIIILHKIVNIEFNNSFYNNSDLFWSKIQYSLIKLEEINDFEHLKESVDNFINYALSDDNDLLSKLEFYLGKLTLIASYNKENIIINWYSNIIPLVEKLDEEQILNQLNIIVKKIGELYHIYKLDDSIIIEIIDSLIDILDYDIQYYFTMDFRALFVLNSQSYVSKKVESDILQMLNRSKMGVRESEDEPIFLDFLTQTLLFHSTDNEINMDAEGLAEFINFNEEKDSFLSVCNTKFRNISKEHNNVLEIATKALFSEIKSNKDNLDDLLRNILIKLEFDGDEIFMNQFSEILTSFKLSSDILSYMIEMMRLYGLRNFKIPLKLIQTVSNNFANGRLFDDISLQMRIPLLFSKIVQALYITNNPDILDIIMQIRTDVNKLDINIFYPGFTFDNEVILSRSSRYILIEILTTHLNQEYGLNLANIEYI